MTETDAEFVERMMAEQPYWRWNDHDRLLALARRGAAVQWRPISEALNNGAPVLLRGGAFGCGGFNVCYADFLELHNEATHFIPLNALGKPNE